MALLSGGYRLYRVSLYGSCQLFIVALSPSRGSALPRRIVIASLSHSCEASIARCVGNKWQGRSLRPTVGTARCHSTHLRFLPPCTVSFYSPPPGLIPLSLGGEEHQSVV